MTILLAENLIKNTKAPVSLYGDLLGDRVNTVANTLWDTVPWERRDAPRRECFFSTLGLPYTYGTGAGEWTYVPREAPSVFRELTELVENICGNRFELCFANGYESEREHLGWHADNSPEIDDNRPIAVMSFGAEREIWVKPNGGSFDDVEKILLPSGSLFVMAPGMQDTHLHRIPKHGAPCGWRVSLTWRGAS